MPKEIDQRDCEWGQADTEDAYKSSAALAGHACIECRDTGEKVVGGADEYAIVFCKCAKGRESAEQQAEVLSDHGA